MSTLDKHVNYGMYKVSVSMYECTLVLDWKVVHVKYKVNVLMYE